MNSVGYEEVKSYVKTGDLVFIENPGRFFLPPTPAVGFCYWTYDIEAVSRLFIADIVGGKVRLTTLSSMPGIKYIVRPDFIVGSMCRRAINDVYVVSNVNTCDWIISVLNKNQMYLKSGCTPSDLYDLLVTGMGWDVTKVISA